MAAAVASLQIGSNLDTNVNLVFTGGSGWLVVADVAIKSLEFWMLVVYAPNIASERCSFFQQLQLFLDDPKQ